MPPKAPGVEEDFEDDGGNYIEDLQFLVDDDELDEEYTDDEDR